MQLHLKITGRVQGVFFRAETQKVAQRLGLTGYAKNEMDGSVTVYAFGEEAKLTELQKWCQEGPELAQVTKVTPQPVLLTQAEFSDFRVL